MPFLSKRLNVFFLVPEYIKGLRDINVKRVRFAEVFTFLALPTLLSVGIAVYNDGLVVNRGNIMYYITPLSILIGFLLNSNGLLMNLMKNENRHRSVRLKNLRHSVISTTFTLISYTTFLGLVLLSVLPLSLINVSASPFLPNSIIFIGKLWSYSLSIFQVFLIVSIILNIIHVLKNMSILFSKEIEMLQKDPLPKEEEEEVF